MLVEVVLLLAAGAALGMAIASAIIVGVYWYRARRGGDE